jgi:hypothetical protein
MERKMKTTVRRERIRLVNNKLIGGRGKGGNLRNFVANAEGLRKEGRKEERKEDDKGRKEGR